MPPYYGPDEDSHTIFLERSFLAADFVSGVGYGIQLVLYLTCATFLWKSRKERRRSTFLLVYISLLLCVETIFEVAQSNTVQMIYVDNRNYPGGPWEYFLATQNLPINILFIASLFSLTFLSDLLVLWRCWVIWSAFGSNLYASLALVFPCFLLLASFALGVIWALQSSQPGLSLYSSLPIAFGTAYLAVSLGVNVVLTFLISMRLLYYRRKIVDSLPEGAGSDYVSLVTILVESASIYSTFALIFLITYALNHPINSVFLVVASAAQQIANYLIIYRLTQGRGWDGQTARLTRLTTLNFDLSLRPEISTSVGLEGTVFSQTEEGVMQEPASQVIKSHRSGEIKDKTSSLQALNSPRTTPHDKY
ncbi:hypothetical protein DXG01_002122 [Tephrocybe rancida]|nr:hypothetical protein DXG01_002122 [Tephrocybe rancida]